MTFNPNIPQAGDVPSLSQGQLLTNFTALNTVFGVDHLAFNAVDGGEHQQVTLNSVIADPGLADPKCSLYIKTVAGDSELFFEKYDNAAAANLVQQMTNLTVTTVGTNYGYTTPWGQIVNWGQFTCNIADTVVTYAVPFNAPAQSIQLTAISDTGSRNAVVRVSANATATCRATNNGLNIYYYAIGV